MAFADDLSDGHDDDPTPPLLPREDRIWRHPSELGAAEQPFVLDPLLVRRRWLSSQPSRASAWTAGLVGALLATGLVVLGTHLASAFTTPRSTDASPAGPGAVSNDVGGTVSTLVAAPSELPVSQSVTAMLERVAAATATIATTVGGREDFAEALVLSPGGDLLAPIEAVAGTSSVLVTFPGQSPYVGDVIATDADAGVAIVRVRNATGLRAAPFAGGDPAPGELVWALGRSGDPQAWGATIGTVSDPMGRASWPVALTADVPALRAPVGTPLVDGSGRVVAIVSRATRGGVLALPAWLATPVAESLAASGAVAHGWLGVECETAYSHRRPVGAQILAVLGVPATGALLRNDVITAIDGVPVTTYLALQSRLYALAPGAAVQIGVERAGKPLQLELHLAGAR